MRISTKKDHQDQTKNAKVMRFQNFPNFAKTLTQFLGYGVCWGENYGEVKIFPKKFVSGKDFLGEILLFFENIFGGHFYNSQFVPL